MSIIFNIFIFWCIFYLVNAIFICNNTTIVNNTIDYSCSNNYITNIIIGFVCGSLLRGLYHFLYIFYY